VSKLQVSLLVWGLWLASFVGLEMAGIFWKRWFTLSRTTWTLENKWAPLAFVILVGLAVLMVHIFVGGPINLAGSAAKRLALRMHP
jgi:hypothetical protein